MKKGEYLIKDTHPFLCITHMMIKTNLGEIINFYYKNIINPSLITIRNLKISLFIFNV